MPSNIDPTKPTSGVAYTADVRQNFVTAADEITNLQADVDALQSAVAALQSQVGALQTQGTNFAGGTWPWQSTPQAFELPPAKPMVGVDTIDPTTAATLAITPVSDDGTDHTGALQLLEAGDRLLVYQRTDSTNQMRFTVTAPGAMSGSYFRIPVTSGTLAGAEPANGAEVNVQFMFA